MNKDKHIYISGCFETGGIYHYIFCNGLLKFKSFTPIDRPMYSIINDGKLYVVLRAPFDDSNDSGIVFFEIDNDGLLKNRSDIKSTKGTIGCHLCVDNEKVYVTNYISGSIIKIDEKLVVHNGYSVNKERQESAHTHCVVTIPNSDLLCVTDLGLDKIFIYNKNLDCISSVDAVPGTGPRHVVFSDDGKYMYCANELSSSVAVYSFDGKNLKYLNESYALPEDFRGENLIAAIRKNGKYIYVSNRGHNSIACFEIGNDELCLKSISDCGGDSPRDFEIVDNFIICANQNDGVVSLLEIADNTKLTLKQKIKVDNALCVTK